MATEAQKAYLKAYYQRNKAKWQGPNKWQLDNPEKVTASKAAYRDRNRDKHNAYNKAWAKANKGKVTEYARTYQALKLNRMPRWLSAKDRQDIVDFYVNRPVGFHVDHIVPLRGKTVSGLHVPWNLQYLPALVNVKKSNKHELK